MFFKFRNKNVLGSWAVVSHFFSPSIGEAEAGRSLSSRPAWFTEGVPQIHSKFEDSLGYMRLSKQKKTN